MDIKKTEIAMWDAAKNKDANAFLKLVDENAVMICGGFQCSGADYAEIIKEFDVADYEMLNYEIIKETETLCQVHYVINITVNERKSGDLEGFFHVTSTWNRINDKWKLIFNMDSKIMKR